MEPRQFRMEMVDLRVAEILSLKTPDERLHIAFQMWEMAREIVKGSVEKQHPEWDDSEIKREVARRMSHGAMG